MMARLLDDVSHALRLVARRPMVSVAIVATMTLGLGLGVMTFTLVDGILLRPLAFPRGEELLSIYSEFRPESGYTFAQSALSPPEVADYAAQNKTVDVGAWQLASVALAQPDRIPEPLTATYAPPPASSESSKRRRFWAARWCRMMIGPELRVSSCSATDSGVRPWAALGT